MDMDIAVKQQQSRSNGQDNGQDRDTVSVLVVDDDSDLCAYLELLLARSGDYSTRRANTIAEAKSEMARGDVDILILDERFPDGSGTDFLAALRRDQIEIPTIFITAHGKVEMGAKANALGAKCFDKPLTRERLFHALAAARARALSPGDAPVDYLDTEDFPNVEDDEVGEAVKVADDAARIMHRLSLSFAESVVAVLIRTGRGVESIWLFVHERFSQYKCFTPIFGTWNLSDVGEIVNTVYRKVGARDNEKLRQIIDDTVYNHAMGIEGEWEIQSLSGPEWEDAAKLFAAILSKFGLNGLEPHDFFINEGRLCVSVKDAAQIIGVSPATVQQLYFRRKLNAFKPTDRELFFPLNEVFSYRDSPKNPGGRPRKVAPETPGL